jgi:hypothetical protein
MVFSAHFTSSNFSVGTDSALGARFCFPVQFLWRTEDDSRVCISEDRTTLPRTLFVQ